MSEYPYIGSPNPPSVKPKAFPFRHTKAEDTKSKSNKDPNKDRTSLPKSSILAPSSKANASPIASGRRSVGAPPRHYHRQGSEEGPKTSRSPMSLYNTEKRRPPSSAGSLSSRGYRSSRIQSPSARTSVSPRFSSSASVGGVVGGSYNGHHNNDESSVFSSGTFRNSTGGAQAVDDSPVIDFTSAIQSLAPDDWRARTLALERLVESVPEESDITADENTTAWYKSPVALRRLENPLSSLLLDPRSTVVKHVTQHFLVLVERVCARDRAVVRHLMKDLLPTIMGLHGQTVNIIRGYTSSMMLEIIPRARFKSGLPTILDRLRRDKSRDVREAAGRYLRAIVESWADEAPVVSSLSEIDDALTNGNGNGNKNNKPYLTKDIATHVGTGLARALMDSSQCVRMEARIGFESFRLRFPRLWHDIVYRDDGVFSKDMKLKKSVINASIRADAERSLREADGSGTVGDDRSLGTYERNIEEEDGVSVLSFDSRGNSTVRTFESAGAGSHGTGRAGSVLAGSRMRDRGGYSKAAVGGAGGPPANRPSGRGAYNRRQTPTNSSGSSIPGIRSSRHSSGIPSVGSSKRQLQSPGTSSGSVGMRAPPQSYPEDNGWFQGATETDVRKRAAESIQAALRGAFVRRELLPDSTVAAVADPTSPRLGTTAAKMAERRRTMGALQSKQVPPAPLTPGTTSIASMSSPITPLDSSFISPNQLRDNSTRVMTPKQRLFASYNANRRSSQKQQPSPASSKGFSHVFSPGSITEETSEGRSGAAHMRMTAGESRNGVPQAPQIKKTTLQLLDVLRERFGKEQNQSQFSTAGRTLLDLHKEHINTLMEVLRAEMDVVAEFERLVASPDVAVQPSEEDVLDYFEAVAVCLDKRTEGGDDLRYAMERICSGDDMEGSGEI